MGNSPPCITMVEKNEGTEIIFTCVNGQSFLLEISSKTEQVLFQKKITVNPKEEIVWNCLDYSDEIIARIIDNSNNQKKVAATSHFQIREKKTTIVKNGITLTRTSPPYCDYPQTISFSRENGIQSGDYLACFLDDRKGWDWCRSNQEITFTCATSLKTMIVRMIYYQNGSWCSRGTPIAELNYPLINPMKEFALSKPSLTVTEKISIHFESYRPLHNCQMIATFQEVEIESVPISSEICEGDYTSSAPRLPGLLTISCIAASCRNGEIATRQIQVCNSPTIIPMELFFQNAPKDRKLQSFTVNEPFTVSTTGSFLRVETDQLLMIPTNDLSFIPETKDLQDSLLQSSAINPLGSTFQLEKVGMYLIILVHLHNGKRLYADSCMVVIVKDHPLNAPCLFFRDAPLTQRHTLCVHPDQLIALDVLIEAADDAIEVILIEMEEIHDNSDSPPMITKDSNIIQRFPVMMTDTSSIIINPFKVEKEGIYNILLTHTKDKTMTTTPTPIVDDYCLLIVSKLVRKATTEPSQLEENREQEVATAAIITPRQLMKQLFAIQGHHIDPIDADIAALKIKRSLRNDQYVSNCDGINTFDCFISYRVESDQEFALELYGLLKEMNFSVFLDKKCLKPGLPWKEGFLKGLQSSNYFIAIISSDGLKKVKDPTVDHRRDNLLLEYETALKISCTMSRPFIIPIFLGKREGNNVLKNFDEFDEMLYPDSLEPLMP